MKAVDFIVEYLIRLGVTDAFGLPGGVVLDLMYAMERRKPEITPHLAYHEQGAVFAACGYAQASRKPGVAYATRGPGVTNMITGIADAYYDSIPLLAVTAHSQGPKRQGMRIETDQEMDPLPLVSGITKYSARVDRAEDIVRELSRACQAALSGRPGPVFLDIHTAVFQAEISPGAISVRAPQAEDDTGAAIAEIQAALRRSRRPVLLIGNGIRQSGMEEAAKKLAEQMDIPVLSSRVAQDIMPDSPWYFGAIGSHGVRYGNFILSKSDLIISLGNRMSFPVNSLSYRPMLERTRTIRVDVDETEFLREVPNSTVFRADLKTLLPRLAGRKWTYTGSGEWVSLCRQIKSALRECDQTGPVRLIARLLRTVGPDAIITGDVGNNEYWVAHAYAGAEIGNRVLYSKSFGTLGSSMGKAIGAYYAARRPVVCFIGDQGFQFNMQELQFIASHRLPIHVVVINNLSSGMIRGREKQYYQGQFLHTTAASGYSVPDLAAIAAAYGLSYQMVPCEGELPDVFETISAPRVVEVRVEESTELAPILPIGNPIQKLYPPIPEELYQKLDEL